MNWIQSRQEELKTQQARNDEIFAHGPKVYDELWGHVKQNTEDAARYSIVVTINGSSYDRVVRIHRPPPGQTSPPYSELHIRLASDRRSITASGPSFYDEIELKLDLCNSGYVCPTFEGNELSVSDAAVKVLDPLFFPELPRRF